MKLNKSGNYVVRGQLVEAGGSSLEPKEINLFDGTYKSGFLIVDFKVASGDSGNRNDVSGKVTTTPVQDGPLVWNWQDQVEVAWASANMAQTSVYESPFSVVDSSVVCVDKLYVYAYANDSTDVPINYYIELMPVDLQKFQYAYSFVQNRSQSVSQ